MKQYYVMTANGSTPPKFVHTSIESAIAEATRLSQYYSSNVKILEIIGEVVLEEVPVTKTVTKLVFNGADPREEDDLPF